ncbi:hypothetical protein P7C70_g8163, partial [Phenoliferia sp. Uapishka_3]
FNSTTTGIPGIRSSSGRNKLIFGRRGNLNVGGKSSTSELADSAQTMSLAGGFSGEEGGGSGEAGTSGGVASGAPLDSGSGEAGPSGCGRAMRGVDAGSSTAQETPVEEASGGSDAERNAKTPKSSHSTSPEVDESPGENMRADSSVDEEDEERAGSRWRDKSKRGTAWKVVRCLEPFVVLTKRYKCNQCAGYTTGTAEEVLSQLPPHMKQQVSAYTSTWRSALGQRSSDLHDFLFSRGLSISAMSEMGAHINAQDYDRKRLLLLLSRLHLYREGLLNQLHPPELDDPLPYDHPAAPIYPNASPAWIRMMLLRRVDTFRAEYNQAISLLPASFIQGDASFKLIKHTIERLSFILLFNPQRIWRATTSAAHSILTSKPKLVGLDTEHSTFFNEHGARIGRGGKAFSGREKTALIQVFTNQETFLLKVFELDKLPQSLIQFLGDSTIRKAGQSIVSSDFLWIQEDFGVTPTGEMELAKLARAKDVLPFGSKKEGLSELTALVLGLHLPKPKKLRLRQWDGPLSEEQLEYAALDSYLSLKVADAITSKTSYNLPVTSTTLSDSLVSLRIPGQLTKAAGTLLPSPNRFSLAKPCQFKIPEPPSSASEINSTAPSVTKIKVSGKTAPVRYTQSLTHAVLPFTATVPITILVTQPPQDRPAAAVPPTGAQTHAINSAPTLVLDDAVPGPWGGVSIKYVSQEDWEEALPMRREEMGIDEVDNVDQQILSDAVKYLSPAVDDGAEVLPELEVDGEKSASSCARHQPYAVFFPIRSPSNSPSNSKSSFNQCLSHILEDVDSQGSPSFLGVHPEDARHNLHP